jgi:hypothetical protein
MMECEAPNAALKVCQLRRSDRQLIAQMKEVSAAPLET